MKIKTFKMMELNPAAYNPRKISKSAFEGLSASIDEFGYIEPIVVNIKDGRNVIVGGHQRYKVMQEKQVDKVECVIVDLDDVKERALNVILNNPHTAGEWERDLFADVVSSIEDHIDFEEFKIDEILEDLGLGQEESEDVPQTVGIDQAIQLKPQRDYVVIMCKEDGGEEFEKLKELLNLQPVRRGGYKYGSAFDVTGTQRVIHAQTFIELMEGPDASSDTF